MKRLPELALSAAALLCAPAWAQIDPDRARQNYLDLLSGRKQPHEMTPRELQQVRQYDATVRTAPKRPPDNRARCREQNATSQPVTPLEDAVLDLKCSQRPE
jgi:hypothetical protein